MRFRRKEGKKGKKEERRVRREGGEAERKEGGKERVRGKGREGRHRFVIGLDANLSSAPGQLQNPGLIA